MKKASEKRKITVMSAILILEVIALVAVLMVVLGVNPENALRKTNKKFIKRFGYVEKKITESDRKLSESTLEEMDKYWEESKNIVE